MRRTETVSGTHLIKIKNSNLSAKKPQAEDCGGLLLLVGRSASGLGEFRPDGLPIIRPQVAAGNCAISGFLNCSALINRNATSPPVANLVSVGINAAC